MLCIYFFLGNDVFDRKEKPGEIEEEKQKPKIKEKHMTTIKPYLTSLLPDTEVLSEFKETIFSISDRKRSESSSTIQVGERIASHNYKKFDENSRTEFEPDQETNLNSSSEKCSPVSAQSTSTSKRECKKKLFFTQDKEQPESSNMFQNDESLSSSHRTFDENSGSEFELDEHTTSTSSDEDSRISLHSPIPKRDQLSQNYSNSEVGKTNEQDINESYVYSRCQVK